MKLGSVPFVLSVLFALAPLEASVGIALEVHPSEGHSRLVVRQMQQELKRTLRGTEAQLKWLDQSNATRQFEGRRVSVTLLGDCTGDLLAAAPKGALGWAKVQDGRVLPYVEIDCDRVRAQISPEILDEDAVAREVQVGRALGRVLAHELAHVMRRDRVHGEDGLTGEMLNSRDLLLGSMRLSASDLTPMTSTRPMIRKVSVDPVEVDWSEVSEADGDGR